MAFVARQATRKVIEILSNGQGLDHEIAKIAQRDTLELARWAPDRIWTENVASDLAEKTVGVRYPQLLVYCESVTNYLHEKFRSFSGRVGIAIEIRVTHDRLEKVSEQLLLLVEAVTNVLEQHRGNWSDGLYYSGGYKVEFGAIRVGGKSFLQVGKIRFELDASHD